MITFTLDGIENRGLRIENDEVGMFLTWKEIRELEFIRRKMEG